MKRFIVFALVSSGLSVLFALVAARLWATPLACAAGVALALAVAAFFFGLSTGDYSWVDRIWSVAPVAFAWIYAAASGFSLGPSLSASLVSLWGARLTFNFARRGGYSGMEDYRWSVLRARITRPLSWQLFNALFICLFQIGVLFLISSPLARLGGLHRRPFHGPCLHRLGDSGRRGAVALPCPQGQGEGRPQERGAA
jgi:steroid 5-alpha reductase family enzyme